MTQETDPKPGTEPQDTRLRGALDGVKAEPIPAKIIELAEKLDKALADTRPKPRR